MNPNQTNPQQLHLLWCPICHVPLNKSWYFAAQINIVLNEIQKLKKEVDKLMKKIESSKDPEVAEGKMRHLFKFIHCKC